MKKIALVVAAMSLSACGALFNGGPANVAVNSNPAGAEVWVDGTNHGVTPMMLSLSKSQNHTIILRRPGYQEATAVVNRKLSTGYLILDILGGLIPVIVDASTGSWYVLETNNVSVNLPGSTTAMTGQLTPEELGAVRLGAPVGEFIDLQQ
ncbi:MAG TPA: PEGA domain-containing protein [Longimicrobium sp.]|nr:PEGA domain-containing protein [Longimicrobium sp.]